MMHCMVDRALRRGCFAVAATPPLFAIERRSARSTYENPRLVLSVTRFIAQEQP